MKLPVINIESENVIHCAQLLNKIIYSLFQFHRCVLNH